MAGNRGGDAVGRVLAAPRTDNPGDGERGESSQCMNGRGASSIDKAVAQPVVHAQLREPPASPDPMRKQRVGQTRQQSRGSANGGEATAIEAGTNGDQGGKTYGEHLQPEREGRGNIAEVKVT